MFDIADFRRQRQTSLLCGAADPFINQFADSSLLPWNIYPGSKNFKLNKSHAYFADCADFFESFQRKD